VETTPIVCVPFQGIMRLRFADLKARIGTGEIGDIILLHQTSRWSIAEDWHSSGSPGWFADPRHVPGGAFIDEGIYWIDLFRSLCGSELVEVDAKIGNLVHKEIAVEDWGMATFTAANGIVATLEASWTINAP
jgi:predicted dehydrogenase